MRGSQIKLMFEFMLRANALNDIRFFTSARLGMVTILNLYQLLMKNFNIFDPTFFSLLLINFLNDGILMNDSFFPREKDSRKLELI